MSTRQGGFGRLFRRLWTSTSEEKSALFGNRYWLHEELGAGSMGVVYRATDRLNGAVVALKRVLVDLPDVAFQSRRGDTNLRIALTQEFQMLAALHHPHIIRVMDYGFDEEGIPFFTMEYLHDGHSLTNGANTHPLETKVRWLVETLRGLEYLYRRGLLHRDLKPGNVMIVDGQAKILDFGLAIRTDQAETEFGAIGTLTYMAPELLIGQGQASVAADLYAVGVMAYELFTGIHPFPATDSKTLIYSVMNETPDLSRIGHSGLAAVVGELLHKKPYRRYPDPSAAIKDLAAALKQSFPPETKAIRDSYLQAAQFVGRQAELKQLTGALGGVLNGAGDSGRPKCWLIGGESGIGKSRLMDELRIHGLVRGALVVRGHAVEDGGGRYPLWRDVLPRLILNLNLTDLQTGVLKAIVPNIDQLVRRDVPDPPALEPKAAEERLIATIADVFRGQSRPVLVLLDDLQWIAEDLKPLQHLVATVKSLPVMIVGGFRDDERPKLSEKLSGMRLIKLKRFNETEAADLSTSMLGQAVGQTDVVGFVHQEAEGNAYFMVEVVRVLAEEAGQLQEVGRVTLPNFIFAKGIQTVVRRRLERVSQEYHPILKLAAVAGRDLDIEILRQIPDVAPQLDQFLLAAANAAVLDWQDGRWRFAHDKLRHALVRELADDERPHLHRTIASAIDAAYPGDASYAEQRAHHQKQANGLATASAGV